MRKISHIFMCFKNIAYDTIFLEILSTEIQLVSSLKGMQESNLSYCVECQHYQRSLTFSSKNTHKFTLWGRASCCTSVWGMKV